MKKFQQILPFILFSFLLSCASTSYVEPESPVEDEKNTVGKSYIISARVVERERIVNGEPLAKTDFYLERSIQDYFIKFCESIVSREELEKNLNRQRASIKILHAEVEYKEGEWDSCDENDNINSRSGSYIIIKRLIE